MNTLNITPKNRSIQELLADMESRRHPMDKAVERNDFQFVKDNLDLNDDIVLYHSVRNGHTQIFEYCFPLFSLESQRKALWIIAAQNRFDYLDFALKYITVDVNDSRPHELACRGGHLDMIKKLESLGIKKSEYSFAYAFESKDLATIQYLYDGEDFTQYFTHQTEIIPLDVLKFVMSKSELSENHKHRILLGAAYVGYIDVIDYLLNLPIPANSEGALFETVYFGEHLDTMKYLLTKAPVLSKISEDDYMALDWAYKHNYLDFVEYIINEHHITPETSEEVYNIFKTDNFKKYHSLKK